MKQGRDVEEVNGYLHKEIIYNGGRDFYVYICAFIYVKMSLLMIINGYYVIVILNEKRAIVFVFWIEDSERERWGGGGG